MIHIGPQYYRPPFPEQKYWEDDLKLMAESGLNTVQLWVVWAWVEPKPDRYDFGDFERIVEIADKNGLQVVLSTIGAVHPYWIHRVVPDSEMVDNMGNKVVSSNRAECHFGLTPGGCFDHAGVWQRMRQYIEATVETFKGASNIAGWDAWNELRWNVQADGLVCYCDHTLSKFRLWLDAKYGGLDGLNEAWKRRYRSWEDVFPGKSTDRPYTELMAFQDFISWRSVEHAGERYKTIKSIVPNQTVTVHGGQPTVLHASDRYPVATALHRGNDWSFADTIDGIGCSSFPISSFNRAGRYLDSREFRFRMESLRSAAGSKKIWLSELQGGRANVGFDLLDQVGPDDQQQWIWSGLSIGAEKVLFWCWRDEVFGRETTGFGMIGGDGMKEERLRAMRHTGAVLRQHDELLSNYRPDDPEVGIFFSPQSVYLYWSQDATGAIVRDSIEGYCRAMIKLNIPYTIIEENHLDRLDGIKILFMPRSVVVDDETAKELQAFVESGGVLFCESETGAFHSNGLFDYPADRWLCRLTGKSEPGRRKLGNTSLPVEYNGASYRLPASSWLTPYVAENDEKLDSYTSEQILAEVPVKNGKVYLYASFAGEGYLAGSLNEEPAFQETVEEFERFIADIVHAHGVRVPAEGIELKGENHSFDREPYIQTNTGRSGDKAVIFAFLPKGYEEGIVRLDTGLSDVKQWRELLSGREIAGGESISLRELRWNIAVLVED